MAVAIPELPPVHGQHRNKALAAARRARAVELRTTGLTYDQIAMELGYANRGTVYHVVSEALKAQTAEAVGLLRSLEVERLDNLQLAVWQKAMDGDVPSARRLFAASSPGAGCWVWRARPCSELRFRGRGHWWSRRSLDYEPGVATRIGDVATHVVRAGALVPGDGVEDLCGPEHTASCSGVSEIRVEQAGVVR